MLPTDPVLLSLQTIVGLTEEVRDRGENSGRVRLVAQPGAVSLDRVAQQYARVDDGHRDGSIVGRAQAVGRGDADGERGPVAFSVSRDQQSSKMRGRGALSRAFLLLLIIFADLRQRVCPHTTSRAASESNAFHSHLHHLRVRTNRAHKYEHPPSRGTDLN